MIGSLIQQLFDLYRKGNASRAPSEVRNIRTETNTLFTVCQRTTFRLSDSLVDLAPRRIFLGRIQRWSTDFIFTRDVDCAFNPIYGQGMTVSAGPHDP